ncbi:MAG: helix-turn-helix transcriptional regulator [Verrucomicrobiota bacterium]
MPSPRPSAQEDFARDLQLTLRRLRAGRLKVRIPPQRDLFRRRPGATFHTTPELFIQTGGATDFACPGLGFRLNTGEVGIIARGVPHAETPLDQRTRYGVLVCMHARDGFFLHRGMATPERRIQGYGTHRVVTPKSPLRYVDDITDHESIPKPERARYVHALLEAFLVATLAELANPRSTPPVHTTPLVTQAQNFVRTHLADTDLSIAGLARALGCSPDHLARQFHHETGLNPSVWIARERIALAKDLLAEPGLNIAEIGWACGFNEPSYFIRVFRKHAGNTPRTYRISLHAGQSSRQFVT